MPLKTTTVNAPGGGVSIVTSGPMFDGRAPEMIDHFCHEVVSELAFTAMDEVMYVQQLCFKQPTGYYWSQMRRDTIADTMRGAAAVVTDQGVIYGPWLEGHSRRNETSRFKGYQAWRKGFQATVAQAPRWIQAVADRVWRELKS